MFVPRDKYLWDFWLIYHGGFFHLFYLQAPRNLPDPELRHGLATVGHAISKDLKIWQDMGTALGPGPEGNWDDRAIWTGSVIAKDNMFYMFYTGTSKAEGGKIERIGLAVSQDLVHWEKYSANPILEADPKWYEVTPDTSPFQEVAWRDPYIIQHGEWFYAFITARKNSGDPKWRGCIAVARSRDLVNWEICEPLKTPECFAQMEVPQIVYSKDCYYLLFSAKSAWSKEIIQTSGIFYMVSTKLMGPYSKPKVLLGNEAGTLYGGKIVQDVNGHWVALAWIGYTNEGFVGGLSDPIPLKFGKCTIEVVQDGCDPNRW